MTTFVILVILMINGVSLLTVSTPPEIRVKLQRNTRIVLACNYSKEKDEEISNRRIKWQKSGANSSLDVANFSPPGGRKPNIYQEFKESLQNRTELIAPSANETHIATLVINDVVCDDEGEYQCSIEYYVNAADFKTESRTLVIFEAEATKPDGFVVDQPTALEENQSIRFVCSADVGNPPGSIQIWKVPKGSNKLKFIHSSNSSSNIDKTENCGNYFNVSLSYNVTRNDDGALFKCSSQNSLTTQPGPSKDSMRIAVLYGPQNPVITLKPSLSGYMYTVGGDVKLDCAVVSNPPSLYKWSFQFTNDTKEKQLQNVSSLLLKNLQTNHSGKYICFAFNTFNGKTYNVTSMVSISVRIPEIQITSAHPMSDANPCKTGEICKEKKGQAPVSFNIWMVLSLIFILLTVIFASTTAYSIIKERPNLQNFLRKEDKNNCSLSLDNKGKDNGEETDQQDGNKLYDTAWR